jgi:hypothetical protein
MRIKNAWKRSCKMPHEHINQAIALAASFSGEFGW